MLGDMTTPPTEPTGKRIALHACCGPCLLEPVDDLSRTAAEVVVVYYNPNIHPIGEYEHRRDTLLEYAQNCGIAVVELPYDPADWIEVAAPHARDAAKRCESCIALRLRRVAQWAAESGFDTVATTLAVSPYQDQEAIARTGEAECAAVGVEFLYTDYRPRYPEATRRSRALGMYRQNYCGCLLSDQESRERRSRRKGAGPGI